MADHLKTGGRPIFSPFLAVTPEDYLPAGVAPACFRNFFLMRLSAVPEEILPVIEENNGRKWRLLSRRRATQIKNKRKNGSGGDKIM